MDLALNNLRAVIFDYGNTLIEFTHEHLYHCDNALGSVLERWYGTVDYDRLTEIRNHNRVAPYRGEYKENHLPTITADLVSALYGHPPSESLLKELLEVRFQTFISIVKAPDYLHDFLTFMAGDYRLGLLSNYPCGNAIRASMRRIGIDHYFHDTVVSADVGHVKPHPLPFSTMVDKLDVQADECLFVGDNWFGDIQGAKRAGMLAAYTIQFETPEKFDPRPGDYQPDLTLRHLADLAGLLRTP